MYTEVNLYEDVTEFCSKCENKSDEYRLIKAHEFILKFRDNVLDKKERQDIIDAFETKYGQDAMLDLARINCAIEKSKIKAKVEDGEPIDIFLNKDSTR